MSSRREFLTQATAVSVAATMSINLAQAAACLKRGSCIKSLLRRDETTLRHGGMGDNFHMSWADDDRQVVGVCDGAGWFQEPKAIFNSRLFTITGGPQEAIFEDIPGYPELINTMGTENFNRYYGFGTLALNGRIYHFLSTPNHPFDQADPRFIGAKLIYSGDHGRTWCNQDGSTPVVWEPWQSRSRKNMLFFREPQEAFSLLSVLQMGRNYEANRDGYVYIYAPNGSTEGTMNQLVMFRVPKARIPDRSTYEYFAGLGPAGNAKWTMNIDARAVVHTFPSGWVNKAVHPWAWMPSVVYNAPLGHYMMATWGTGVAADGMWFAKPSYLGFWVASNPWGPWRQIHEETAWTPNNDPKARAFSPQIPPKWIAADGKSFWLVWSDFQGDFPPMPLEEVKRMSAPEVSQMFRRHKPYYSFNAQRVDLVIA